MPLLDHINFITVFLIGVFLLPIAAGLLRPLTGNRIYSSFNTTISAVLVIVSAVLSVCVTELLFSDGGDNPLGNLFKGIPVVWYSIISQDVLVYVLLILILLVAFNGLFQLLLIPLNKKVIYPVSDRLGKALDSMNKVAARIIGGLWQLPKSAWLVLVFALLFNFYSMLSSNASLDSYINNSAAYRLIDNTAVQPIISSEAARQIPAFIDKTVDKAVECLSPEGRKLLIKVYINGVTVDDAIASSPDIDNVAIELVGAENDRYLMAEKLYDWVVENISYDNQKADALLTDAFASPSGAVVAFSEKTGVCFDKASLYVAMCRAVGVQVRLITGCAFNGADWLDHSWNEIYYDKQDRWVNVDTTFGSKDRSYFDNSGFWDDHKDREVQGEW
ncbi:Transglutaminase-like superfamily protein [Sporobacter termitidis DSM 10068]|uniref:Transglutaminase-like superfamily protein n=1 Tax=Sporobacter termitidis DSM 10068 TaxID=1123282 RepID=A0A1M5Z9S2_9FIRM|nr:transglutaminase-like domain-containing protein [Sporobacter termitidis]SHI20959.1 Transglutaminase-like superfamily protein [Sporobacter termitidis DSM 10068]